MEIHLLKTNQLQIDDLQQQNQNLKVDAAESRK